MSLSHEPPSLSRLQVGLLTLAGAVVTANAYYIHPIIARVAQDFAVAPSEIGLVPAFNQVALALGIFLLLPLGDRFNNRRLITIFVSGQFISITLMALAPGFFWFVAGSTLLGFFTIAPYLLPAYVSKRVSPGQLGHVTAMLTTGVLAGILLARTGSGVIGEYLGWRAVYYVAAGLMFLMALILPLIMEDDPPVDSGAGSFSYGKLLASLVPIVRQNPEIILSGVIQALNFGLFLSVWLGLGLHLTSPEMGYGVDVVGYMALIAILNLFTTPRMGRYADRVGPRRARLQLAVLQALAMLLIYPFGWNLWLLLIPLIVLNLVGPPMDVAARMLFLSQEPGIRTRLTTVYIVIMFLGGGLASWAGTAAYEWGGWTANAGLAVAITALAVSLSAYSLHRYQR